MADSGSGYKVGPGGPPLHTRFKKGQSGNPDARSARRLPVAVRLDETGLGQILSCVASKPVGSVPWVGDVGGGFSLADA